ncbi:MAG TPA: hypothetical protein VF534_01330 [Paraburkholderia sp.]
MYTVKFRQGDRFVIERYPDVDWRNTRAIQLVTDGIAVTLSKTK